MAKTTNVSATEPLVMHQVNNQGVMGAGVARQIRDDISTNDFLKYHFGVTADPQKALGMVYTADSLRHPERTYLNVVGQDGYGSGRRFTDYDALVTAFDQIAKTYPGKALALPYNMGACRGGGDWNVIEDLINEHLAPYMDVTAYRYDKG